MTRRKSPYVLNAKTIVSTAIFAALLSCGDPKEDSSAISIAFSPGDAPPASLETGAYAGVAATVTGDPQFGGVEFECTPATPEGACGTFSFGNARRNIGSTVVICYLAPPQIPPGGTVTITATAIDDPTKSVSGIVTIVNGAPNPCP